MKELFEQMNKDFEEFTKEADEFIAKYNTNESKQRIEE